jgi:hypothetical protein
MKLPKVLVELIWDFYWSHKTFEQKQCMHRELIHLYNLHEIKEFYVVLNSMYHVQTIGE